ncbi:MAG: hypothetical protein E7256_07570 [Lachnospiraceae bacterium]|nr:hypothetical protein [Lachnospiraceae bacterium]
MRTYDAIEVIGQKVINRGLCEAILLKGSIGRGDDDEFSDVDMYLIVKEEMPAICGHREYFTFCNLYFYNSEYRKETKRRVD